MQILQKEKNNKNNKKEQVQDEAFGGKKILPTKMMYKTLMKLNRSKSIVKTNT